MSNHDRNNQNTFRPLIRPQPLAPAQSRHRNIYNQVQLDWYIPSKDRHKLSNYYILHWTPEYLFSTYGQYRPIIRENITYLIIYHNCHPKELRACKVVLLSFRKLPDMKTGYVLATPAKSLARQYIDKDL